MSASLSPEATLRGQAAAAWAAEARAVLAALDASLAAQEAALAAGQADPALAAAAVDRLLVGLGPVSAWRPALTN
jgi:hypothetical protein